MKVIIAVTLAIVLLLSFSACGCSNSMVGETKIPEATILPSILPTLDTNIPDPDIDTQMPIYTDGTDSTDGTDVTIPHNTQTGKRK